MKFKVKPRSKTPGDLQPLYMRTQEMLTRLIDTLKPGDRLLTEPELAAELGISRATLREAMRLFEERGRLMRKPGVGTFVLAPHPVIDSGLEVLESIDTLARRLNLPTRMAELTMTIRAAEAADAGTLGIAVGAEVLAISRTIYTEQVPIAHLTDVLPAGAVTREELENFSGSVLDILLKRNDPVLGVSHTQLTAESADTSLARHLGVQRGTPVLHIEATLYTHSGEAIDHSHSYFVPGFFKFHVVRKVGK